MKIVFFGTPQFAIPSLESLINAGFEISAVITQPDKPFGRNKELSPSPVKIKAEELNLKILTPHSLKESFEIINELKELNAELGVVVAYGKIIPTEILNIFPKGVINLHPSMLPKYRGPSPIPSAIMNGDNKTGISIMLLDEGMDSGPILYQEEYLIDDSKNAGQILDDIFRKGALVISKVAKEYLDNNIKPAEQDHSKASITQKLNHENGLIDSSDSSTNILNKIRAYTPEPGAWIKINNKKIIIIKASISDQIIPVNEVKSLNKELLIGTKDKAIKIEVLKPEGKKEMSALDFINGNKI